MNRFMCRYYDESGEPIRGGCRRRDSGGCMFVHPGDSDWANARVPRPRDDSGSDGFKPYGGDRDSGYGRRNSAANAVGSSGGWDTGGGRDSGSRTRSAGGGWNTGGRRDNGGDGRDTGSRRDSGSAWITGWGTENERDTGRGQDCESAWGNADGWDTGNGQDAGRGQDKETGSAWGKAGGCDTGSRQDAGRGQDTSGSVLANSGGWDTGSGQDSGSAWGGGWGAGSGRDNESGRDTGSGRDSGSAWGGGWDPGVGKTTRNPFANSPRNKPQTVWNRANDTASGKPKKKNNVTDTTTGSESWSSGNVGGGWGPRWESENVPWGESSSEATKMEKTTASGSEITFNGESSWGINKDTSNSGGSDAMAMDNRAEKDSRQNKEKAKVPAPPRIRIPDDEGRKSKIAGTNNEPLGTSRWGSNPLPAFASVAPSTPVSTSTPTDWTRVKRKRDAVFDEKADIFREYIKICERAVRTQGSLSEAEAKLARWVRTQKSHCYAHIGEAGRKKLDGQRVECEKEVNLQRDKLSSTILSLIDFHDTVASQLDLGQRYNISEEAGAFITESKTFIDEVRGLLVKHVLKDKNDVHSSDTPKHSSRANTTLIDSLQSRVQDLEERFDQAMTELTLRHQRDIRSEIDEHLAIEISGLRLARQQEVDHAVSQLRHDIVIPPSALENMEATAQQAKELDTKIPHTVEDIRDLLLRVDATSKRVGHLEEEVAINKEAYIKKMQGMVAQKEEAERRVDERLTQMRAQFEQLVASQPANPGAHPTELLDANSRQKLIEILLPSFEANLNEFYEQQIRPTVNMMQKSVIAASDRHHQEAIQVVWGRIQPAMNMVAGVSRWLDSQELGITAPVNDG